MRKTISLVSSTTITCLILAAMSQSGCVSGSGRFSIMNDKNRTSAMTNRSFLMGLSVEDSGLDRSPAGERDLIDKIGESADITSIFFHVHWNKLLGRPLLKDFNEQHGGIVGHERNLKMAEMAREKGLKILIMFDFSHDGQESDRRDLGVGRLNRFPDGSELPEGGFDNPEIREAPIMIIL